ncbi:thiamine-binding protein [Agrilactobacillus fermenti]|uniref:thiamine-binding protein n=1 Tax=Agrilactobacillus fermenti TaxID=2586909 RepID=UPI003A5BA726
MNASVAIQVLPMGQATKDVLAVVDQVVKYIQEQGLHYEVSAFETTLEGDYDQLMKVVTAVPKIAAEAGADSVMTYVKINYQSKGDALTIDEKTHKYQH